ncbi:MAG TPA: DUF6719 family protein [Xanthobacteraceae bacterium]|nr:DUF6719 family protein [Xanthobacteraceae bacterium]
MTNCFGPLPSARKRLPFTAGAAAVLAIMLAVPAGAQQLSRESDIGQLRLGQRVLIDDGTCPAGQIKEVVGVSLTASGVSRTRQCVPRKGTRR